MTKIKKNTETGVALKSQFTQNDVPAMLEKVNEEISKLKGDKEKIVRISGALGPFGIVSSIKDIPTLVKAYSYITSKAKAYADSAEPFKSIDPSVKIPAFDENGASLKQWQEEILMQYREVTFESKLAKLKAVKEELEKNLSAEMKLAASLANIADILNFEVTA
jgi:hypothetical protein